MGSLVHKNVLFPSMSCFIACICVKISFMVNYPMRCLSHNVKEGYIPSYIDSVLVYNLMLATTRPIAMWNTRALCFAYIIGANMSCPT